MCACVCASLTVYYTCSKRTTYRVREARCFRGMVGRWKKRGHSHSRRRRRRRRHGSIVLNKRIPGAPAFRMRTLRRIVVRMRHTCDGDRERESERDCERGRGRGRRRSSLLWQINNTIVWRGRPHTHAHTRTHIHVRLKWKCVSSSSSSYSRLPHPFAFKRTHIEANV